MNDIAKRFSKNPLLKPADLKSSTDGLEITCLLNPGVFQFEEKTWLIVRVAERPAQKENIISFPVLTNSGNIKIIEISKIQAITTSQLFWHKSLNIGSLTLHTAGGNITFHLGNYKMIQDYVNLWLYEIETSDRNWM